MSSLSRTPGDLTGAGRMPSREPAWLALLEVLIVAGLVAAPALPAPGSAAAIAASPRRFSQTPE